MARRHPIDRPFGKHKLHLMFFCSKLKWKHVIMFSFWFATIGWNQLCCIVHKFIMVFPKLKNKVMSNKTSRKVNNTNMKFWFLGNMAWRSLAIMIQFHMGSQSFCLSYFLNFYFKSFCFLLCKFAFDCNSNLLLLLSFLHVFICMVLIKFCFFIVEPNW